MATKFVGVSGINAVDNPGPGIGVARSLKEDPGLDVRIIGLAYDAMEPGIYMDWIVLTISRAVGFNRKVSPVAGSKANPSGLTDSRDKLGMLRSPLDLRVRLVPLFSAMSFQLSKRDQASEFYTRSAIFCIGRSRPRSRQIAVVPARSRHRHPRFAGSRTSPETSPS